MIYKLSFFAFVVLCATIGHTNGQDGCVPMQVDYVYMLPNGTLVWQVLPDEPCTITDFVVYINQAYAEDETEERVVETKNPFVDVSFLAHCHLWNFTVVAVSYAVRSDARRVFVRVPITSPEDLAVRIVSVTESDGDVLLLWDAINPECADRFRIEYKEINSDRQRGIWSFHNYVILPDVPFCSEYEFSVRAFHGSATQVEGPTSTATHVVPPGRTGPPRLLGIGRGPTFFNTTWAVDSYARNHCTIRSVRINGAPNFAISIPYSDSTLRLPVTVQITNLRPETMYVFRASVFNDGGESSLVPVAAQTTSLTPDIESY